MAILCRGRLIYLAKLVFYWTKLELGILIVLQLLPGDDMVGKTSGAEAVDSSEI